ncbi:MAG: polysaccharide export periplasmic protein [uncultured bacterium]|nr:MAG: polysaccharide export periplasmic protein [uncultured bacterium]
MSSTTSHVASHFPLKKKSQLDLARQLRSAVAGLSLVYVGVPIAWAQLATGDMSAVQPPSLSAEVSQFLSTYKMGTGDVISIRVFGEPELSVSNLRLSDVGTVFLPTLGETRVGGLTLGEVEKAVADRLRGRILVNPRVSVSVEQYRPFFMNGMVKSPGSFPYQPGLTVRKASSLAGGLHERASLKKIFVIRANDPTQQMQRIDFDSVVFPGDIVTIEESFF